MHNKVAPKNPPNISAIVQHMNVSLASRRSSRVRLQNRTFILRKVVENLCDMAFQKYCKIVVSKDVCLFTLRDPAPLTQRRVISF